MIATMQSHPSAPLSHIRVMGYDFISDALSVSWVAHSGYLVRERGREGRSVAHSPISAEPDARDVLPGSLDNANRHLPTTHPV
jgi:hypothetical protein